MDDCAEEVGAQSQNCTCRVNTFTTTRPSQLVEALSPLSTGEGEKPVTGAASSEPERL